MVMRGTRCVCNHCPLPYETIRIARKFANCSLLSTQSKAVFSYQKLHRLSRNSPPPSNHFTDILRASPR